MEYKAVVNIPKIVYIDIQKHLTYHISHNSYHKAQQPYYKIKNYKSENITNLFRVHCPSSFNAVVKLLLELISEIP